MVLQYWASYAINVNRLKSLSLECLHVLMLPFSIKAVGYISLCLMFSLYSFIHLFIYFIVNTCMHKEHFIRTCVVQTHNSRLLVQI